VDWSTGPRRLQPRKEVLHEAQRRSGVSLATFGEAGGRSAFELALARDRISFLMGCWCGVPALPGRMPAFQQREKPVQAFEVTRPIALEELIVFAGDFPERFRLVGRREILFGMMETNQRIATTVQNEHGHSGPRQFAVGVVV